MRAPVARVAICGGCAAARNRKARRLLLVRRIDNQGEFPMTNALNPTIVERAAEAMWTLDYKVKGGRWDTAKDRVRDEYRDLALAALSVIPEVGEEAVRAEREECAKIADDVANGAIDFDESHCAVCAENIAGAIRARSADNPKGEGNG